MLKYHTQCDIRVKGMHDAQKASVTHVGDHHLISRFCLDSECFLEVSWGNMSLSGNLVTNKKNILPSYHYF